MIYKLIQGKDPFELNPGLRVIPEFDTLSPHQMFFVCLVADPSHDNPLRSLIGRPKRDQAAKIAGYKMESDGKRLDKNGRMAAMGQIKSIETAIEKFKELHHNPKQKSIDVIRKQIGEIRDFLESDKEGDVKKLKAAMEFGVKLPDLETALEKLQDEVIQDIKFEGQTFTGADLIPEEGMEDSNVPAIELWHMNQEKLRNDSGEV